MTSALETSNHTKCLRNFTRSYIASIILTLKVLEYENPLERIISPAMVAIWSGCTLIGSTYHHHLLLLRILYYTKFTGGIIAKETFNFMYEVGCKKVS